MARGSGRLSCYLTRMRDLKRGELRFRLGETTRQRWCAFKTGGTGFEWTEALGKSRVLVTACSLPPVPAYGPHEPRSLEPRGASR